MIGSGTRYGYLGLTLDKVFANGSTFDLSSSTCIGSTTYASAVGDPRELYAWFESPSMVAFEEMPVTDLNYAPLAIETEQISGYKATSLLRTDSSVATTAPLTSTQYTQLLALIGGTSSQYSQASGNGGTEIITNNGNITSPSVGSLWLDTSSNTLKVYTSSGVETVTTSTGSALTSITQGAGISVSLSGTTATVGIGSSAITSGMLTSGAVTATSLDPAISILTSGGVSSASLSSRILTLSNSQTPIDSTHNEISLVAPPAAFAAYTLTMPSAKGTDGQLLRTDASGNLSWSTVGVGTSMPSLASAQIYVGSPSNTPTAVTPTGDLSLTNAGLFTVTGLQGVGIGNSAPSLAGQVLRYDSSTSKYQANFLSMADIRSVTMPGTTIFPSTSCTSAQVLNWSSLTDQFTCTAISVTAGSISGLGTAALLNVGIGSLSVVQLDSSSRLPPVSGSQLTNLNGSSLTSGTVDPGRLPASANTWAINGGDIYNTNGTSVGIGTSTPAYALDVNGTVQAGNVYSGGIVAASQGTGALPSHSFMGDTTSGLWQPSIGAIALSTSGSERLRVVVNGNVGIGTTVPDRPFLLVNNSTSTIPSGQLPVDFVGDQITPGLQMQAYGPGGINPQILGGYANGTYASPTASSSGTTMLAMGSYPFDGTSWYNSASLQFRTRGGQSPTNHGSSLIFSTTATNSTNSAITMILDTAGYLGLGSGTPTSVFQIQNHSLSVTPSANTGAYMNLTGVSLNDGTTAASATTPGLIAHSISAPTLTATNTSVTTTNAASLYLGGAAIASTNEMLTNSSALYIPSNNVQGTGGAVVNAYGVIVNAPTGATNNYAAAFNGGNVGIGTTVPASTLDVNGTANINGSENVNGTLYATGLLINGQAVGTSTSSYWNQSGSTLSYTSGNVGVGTGSPGTALTVGGPVALKAPSTISTTAYTVAATDSSLIFNASATVTLTMPAAASYPGRILYVKTITAKTLVSANSNIAPQGSATIGTAILAATAGKFAMLQSDGTNWVVMMSN